MSLVCTSLGEAWLRLVDLTVRTGELLAEGYEVLGAGVVFPGRNGQDLLIERFGDPRMIAEMRKVFFDSSANALGHSYAGLMRGPEGRGDLQDIIALLTGEPLSKRAVLTFGGEPGGKVPCVNLVQFLVRGGRVQTIYFARGQDAYKKFYADGLCLMALAEKVGQGLDRPVGLVRGYIGSSHVYREDLPRVEQMLQAGWQALSVRQRQGGG
jgi:hypothetical protein